MDEDDFRLAGPAEWDPSDAVIDLGGGLLIHERVRVQILWKDCLVSLHLKAGDPAPLVEDPSDDVGVWIEQLDVRRTHGPGIQSQDFRALPLASMLAQATERATFTSRGGAGSPRVNRLPVRRFDHRRLTPRHLALVAAAYVEALDAGWNTARVIAEKWSVSDDTATKWIYRARQEGLLTKTTPGQRGGVLTSKAQRILSEPG